jgi:hypothetical protein
MIKSLYGKYFQKSKSFLFPALGIKKNSKFTPSNTYVAVDGYIDAEDVKLICTYDKPEIEDDEDYLVFEQHFLLENPLFLEKIETKEMFVYVFDYQIYTTDWFNFILGKYSKLSSVLKRAIKTYYGDNSAEYRYIDSYLYPEEYYEDYSVLLDVNVDQLKSIGQLCNACDIKKETLKISKEYLESLNKTI